MSTRENFSYQTDHLAKLNDFKIWSKHGHKCFLTICGLARADQSLLAFHVVTTPGAAVMQSIWELTVTQKEEDMKNHIRNFIFMIGTILLFGASSAGAVPVELKFTGLSGMYDGAYQFSGSILYETDAFVTDTYDVALATDDSYPPFYAGNSSYIQSMQSNSLFRLESSNWEGFDIESFNTASNFVNSIRISTGFEDGPPRSTITFVSFSDQYSLVVENVHMEVHAVAYAADKKIYDIPTSATPFWPDFTDYSEYYYTFREVDFEDAGGLNGLTPVPEPGTVLLLGAGLAALVAFGKRQRVQARKVVYPPRA